MIKTSVNCIQMINKIHQLRLHIQFIPFDGYNKTISLFSVSYAFSWQTSSASPIGHLCLTHLNNKSNYFIPVCNL